MDTLNMERLWAASEIPCDLVDDDFMHDTMTLFRSRECISF